MRKSQILAEKYGPERTKESPVALLSAWILQVERMNRTLKEATVKRFYYQTHEHFRQHLTDFVHAYNFAKKLKTLKGLTPYEYRRNIWTKEAQRFKLNPTHLTLGPYT